MFSVKVYDHHLTLTAWFHVVFCFMCQCINLSLSLTLLILCCERKCTVPTHKQCAFWSGSNIKNISSSINFAFMNNLLHLFFFSVQGETVLFNLLSSCGYYSRLQAQWMVLMSGVMTTWFGCVSQSSIPWKVRRSFGISLIINRVFQHTLARVLSDTTALLGHRIIWLVFKICFKLLHSPLIPKILYQNILTSNLSCILLIYIITSWNHCGLFVFPSQDFCGIAHCKISNEGWH